MNNPFSEKIIEIISFFFEMVFHEKVSEDVEKLIKNLSYIGFGIAISTICGVGYNIYAGRILGPTGYGEFTLVQTISMFLYLPMIFGFSTAMIKYSCENHDTSQQRVIVSTASVLIIFFITLSTLLYILFIPQLSKIFSVSESFLFLSVILAILYSLYIHFSSILLSLDLMKIYSSITILQNVLIAIIFLFFVMAGFVSFKSILFSFFITYCVICAIIFVIIIKYVKLDFDKTWAGTLAIYAVYAMIGAVSSVFYTNIDKLMIQHLMSLTDLGIYRAYSYSSINVMGLLTGVFFTVFFPFASKYKNKDIIFIKIQKITPYLFIFGFPFVMMVQYFILKLYGGNYPVNPVLMVLFAIASLLIAYYGIYDWTFCSAGIPGIKLVGLSTVSIAIANIILNIILIPLFGLAGAISSTIFGFIIGIFFLSRFKRLI